MHKTHSIELQVPKDEVEAHQSFLDSAGEDKVGVIETYTAKFGDRGEGNVEIDIKVCQGDPPFVDAVMFQDGSDVSCIEPDDELLGTYTFQSVLKDTYKVKLVPEYEK